MAFETLLPTAELAAHLDDPDWAIMDCRFYLDEPDRGLQAYLASHVPGAIYVHLERDLCGPIARGKGSRHSFPSVESFAVQVAKWGIDESVQVVVYDDFQGGIAVRLWRMLGWVGHKAVALLDGGWPHWVREGPPVQAGPVTRPPRAFVARHRPELLISSEEALRLLASPSHLFLDTRSERSYTGQKDPDSPTSGHMPGAHHMHFTENVDQDGLMLHADELRAKYERLLGSRSADSVIAYCTSGVTAALNILALQHIGLGEVRLYAGSWDEWITDPSRPVEKSPQGPGKPPRG